MVRIIHQRRYLVLNGYFQIPFPLVLRTTSYYVVQRADLSWSWNQLVQPMVRRLRQSTEHLKVYLMLVTKSLRNIHEQIITSNQPTYNFHW